MASTRDEDTGGQAPWWGTFTLDEKQAGCWRVGPSTVWIYRARREWRVVHRQDDDLHVSRAHVTLPTPLDEIMALDAADAGITVSRFSFRQTDAHLAVRAALADRSLVLRPEKPLYVLAGETVTLYVSTPLWLCIEVGEPARMLQEIPSHRPSDTWFGPSTREGELCYATTSTGRLNLRDLPLRLHRAVTPLLIQNRADDTLSLERVRLPVHYLSLFQAANDFLWTQSVTFSRNKGDDQATLVLGEGPPPEAQSALLVSGPRQEQKTTLIARTFGTLIHKLKDT